MPASADPLPALVIVIVNYRSGELVVRCLESLAPEIERHPGTRVVVVDNDSRDGSVERLQAAAAGRDWLRIDAAPCNGGFAYGNNRVLRAELDASDDDAAFWLLNPDTEVRPGALGAVRAFLRDHPQLGVMGTAIENPDGSNWPITFRFPSILSELEAALHLRWLQRWAIAQRVEPVAQTVQWLSGASLVVRCALLRRIGLMDEGFFLYYEETDLCKRAADAGWERWYAPQAKVVHIGGASTGVNGSRPDAKRLPAYWFESRRRYFLKHHGLAYTLAADLAWMAGHLSFRLRRALMRRPALSPPRVGTDFVRHSAWLHPSLPGNPALERGGSRG